MGDSALEIGAILGDSDAASMVWSRAIGDVALRAEELSASLASPISVNVVFHVDGRHVPNEFEGVPHRTLLSRKLDARGAGCHAEGPGRGSHPLSRRPGGRCGRCG